MGGYSDYTSKIFLVLCFALVMLFFSIMFSLKYMAEDKGIIGCTEKPGSKPVYDLGKAVNSKGMAEKIVGAYLDGKGVENDVVFRGTTFENCGPSFSVVDKVSGGKFFVCENGKAYEYVKVCDGD